jgi:outer membrane protein OmpA-like peptidoglycan-associated protein
VVVPPKEEPKPVPPPPPVEEPKPVPAPVVEAPKVVAPAPEPVKIMLDEAILHFANGKANLSQEGVEAIQKVAEHLKKIPGAYSLTVSGHTSNVG